MRLGVASVLFLAAAVFSVPPADAHTAAPPRETFFRQAHDCNDDWGGHAAVNDGHDLIAIDLTERYLDSLGKDAVVVRMIMNGGYASTPAPHAVLTDALSFAAPAKAVEVQLATPDNVVFTAKTGSGFTTPSWISGKGVQNKTDSTPDGDRFWVEVAFTYDQLGAKVGDKLTGFRIVGHANDKKADYVPGGVYTNEVYVSQCPGNSTSTEGDDGYFVGSGYTLKGSGAVDFTTMWDAAPAVVTGGMATKSLTLQSALKKSDQKIALTAIVPQGWTVMFMPSESFSLPKDGKVDAMVHLTPSADAGSGAVNVIVRSDAGGVTALATSVTAPPPPTTSASSPAVETAKKSAPGTELASIIVALGVAFVLRRS